MKGLLAEPQSSPLQEEKKKTAEEQKQLQVQRNWASSVWCIVARDRIFQTAVNQGQYMKGSQP